MLDVQNNFVVSAETKTEWFCEVNDSGEIPPDPPAGGEWRKGADNSPMSTRSKTSRLSLAHKLLYFLDRKYKRNVH